MAHPILQLGRGLLGGLLELALPPRCAACDAASDEGSPFCDDCRPLLSEIDLACPRCGLPLVGVDPPAPPCIDCLRRPPPWRAARSPLVYAGPLGVAVRRWKIGGRGELVRLLAPLLTPTLLALPADIDGLVPVPLHPRRLRQRQFDQAWLLAARARLPSSPPLADLLERHRDTPSQSGTLDRKARRTNVAGAFRLRRGVSVTGRRLCLVDDVLTTGATAAACAAPLLDAGAASVDVLTLARALP